MLSLIIKVKYTFSILNQQKHAQWPVRNGLMTTEWPYDQ